MSRKTLKAFVRARLAAGRTLEQAWHDAEIELWYAPWNYVQKIGRDWKRDKAHEETDA